MDYLEGYKDATDLIEEICNGIAREVSNGNVKSKKQFAAQLDKVFSLAYMMRYNIELMKDEPCRDCEEECNGEMPEEVKNIIDEMFESIFGDNNEGGNE